LEQELKELEALILQDVQTDIPLLTRVAEHILRSGGKRLRPLLVLLGARSFGTLDLPILQAAQVVEYLHTATLLHDDVVDGADMRRSQQAARTIWGNEASVLVGDYLLALAFRMLTGLRNPEVLQLMSHTTRLMARGELLQLTRSYRQHDLQEYLDIIHYKTASLFGAAARMGALLNGAGTAQADALFNYGVALGMAFQMVDDALDYSEELNIGKPIGTDLQERKVTLPLSHLMEHASPAERKELEQILELPEIGQLEIRKVAAWMRQHGSIEHTLESARNYVLQAQAELSVLPDEGTRTLLHEIADYVVRRTF
jgi:octaprenyl-diphosphate synthase